ncbi:MAG: [Fe-Fe] hydrogenase large subunit C-terminal domain-containing protein [Clostridia bacterium]|nr:[Fe-Fe] hydrogenase large subunit C-terminal domain-containing protein [Clostridia bacterium]
MTKFFHSVMLEKNKCVGCTNCVKRCPTQAIRVRNGKAVIHSKRCIDCGECIRVCPHKAKKAATKKISIIKDFEYTVAIPDPSLFGQFNNLKDINVVLTAIKKLGFNFVYEASRGAELIMDSIKKLLEENRIRTPIISSACPAIVRLIRLRFPDLCDNVLELEAPMEVTAKLAKDEISEKYGIPFEKIKAVFIAPCPAKVSAVAAPLAKDKSWVDAVISIGDVYPLLISEMSKLSKDDIEDIAKSGSEGIGWGVSSAAARTFFNEKYLAADGIENAIRILEELEEFRIRGIDFIELSACSAGCVGGVMCVENAYVAKAKIHKLMKDLPLFKNSVDGEIPDFLRWEKELEFEPVLKLSEDVGEAIALMDKMDKLYESLPGMDCGSCGAPTCRAFAEDVVMGRAKQNNCIYILKDHIEYVIDTLEDTLKKLKGVTFDDS